MCERLICYPWKYPVYLLDLVSWLVTQKDMLCKQKCKTPSLPINLLNLVGQSLVKPIILQTKWYQCKLGTLLTLCKLLWNRSFIFSRKTQVSSSLSDGKMVFYVLAIKPWVVLCTFCLQMECLSELIVSRRYRIYACWVKVIMPERSRYRTSENTYLPTYVESKKLTGPSKVEAKDKCFALQDWILPTISWRNGLHLRMVNLPRIKGILRYHYIWE